MTISATDFLKNRETRVKAAARNLIKEIDDAINSSLTETVTLQYRGDAPSEVIDFVREEYNKVGWNVFTKQESYSDQRDGTSDSYLSIKLTPNRKEENRSFASSYYDR